MLVNKIVAEKMSYSQVRVITHNRAPVRYEVGQLLGMGGYGATFQATAINLLTGANNQVAIKFVFPSDTVSYSDAILEADNYAKVADIAVSAGITTISCQVNLVCFTLVMLSPLIRPQSTNTSSLCYNLWCHNLEL